MHWRSSVPPLPPVTSGDLPGRAILGIVLCGDLRFGDMFRSGERMPLGTRIRHRLTLEPTDPQTLLHFLEHLLDAAGNPQLMTQGLRDTLVSHAAGSYRILTHRADALLAAAEDAQREQRDEALHFEVFPHAVKRRGIRT